MLVYLLLDYVQDLLKKSKEFSKYLKSIQPDETQNYIALNEIDRSTLSPRDFKSGLFILFQNIIGYNSLELHKQNKLIFLFFIEENRIFYDKKNKNFIYNINTEIDYENQINRMIENQEEFFYIQPELNSYLSTTGKGLTHKHKHNRFLCWSMGIFILKKIIQIEPKYIEIFYSKCLNEIDSDYNLDDIVDFNKIQQSNYLTNANISKLNKFFNCSNDKDDEEIVGILQYL